ncbi:MAG: hypothetical protein ACMUJM_21890, partial [bacterium]
MMKIKIIYILISLWLLSFILLMPFLAEISSASPPSPPINPLTTSGVDKNIVVWECKLYDTPIRTGQITGAENYLNGCGIGTIDDNYAYIIGSDSDSFVIIDISDKENPSRVGLLTGSENYLNGATDAVVDGNCAIVVSYDSNALVIIDISNKENPFRVTQLTTGNYLDHPTDVDIQGDYVYVVNNGSYSMGHLVIFDISDKENPFRTGNIDLLARGYHVSVRGNYAYVSAGNQIRIYNISNKENPVYMGMYTTDINGCAKLAFKDNYMYMPNSCSFSLAIADISNPESPVPVGSVSGGLGKPLSVVIKNEHAYVAALNEGIAVVDISDKEHPVVAGKLPYAGNYLYSVSRILIDDYYAYATAGGDDDALVIMQISDFVSSYNLYWKKDKVPNCYFTNLDNFAEYTEIGTETASIVNNKVRLEIPGGSSYSIAEIYDFLLGLDNFEVSIDISNYTPDNTTDGVRVHFRVSTQASHPWPANFFNIYFNQSGASQYSVDCTWRINGVASNTGQISISNIPTKLKIGRIGTVLYGYYYTSSWVQFGSVDFGSAYNQLECPTIFINDLNYYGGSVDFDNLIITPSVKDSGTKISDILNLTYDHESLEAGHVYCYEVTAVKGGESEPSKETYGIPLELSTPDQPTDFNVSPGIAKNIISWDASEHADSYNLYWATTPGITVDTGTKIEDAASPYIHLIPTVEDYYYIVTAVNQAGESDPSDEVAISSLLNPSLIISSFTCDSAVVDWNGYVAPDDCAELRIFMQMDESFSSIDGLSPIMVL